MKKVLIADTDKASLLMTSEILKDHYPGIKICTAYTLADALKIAKTQQHDAYIVDFNLPDLSISNIFQKMKTASKTPIFFTGFDLNRFKEGFKGEKYNLDHEIILKKPLHPDILCSLSDFYHNGIVKPAEPVLEYVHALLEISFKFSKQSHTKHLKNNLAKRNMTVPVIIKKCSLNSITFQINQKFSSLYISREDEKIIHSSKIIDSAVMHFQNPDAIEEGDFVHDEQIESLKKNVLNKIFNYSLTGKLKNNDKNIFSIEFENVILARRIYEALARYRMNKQIYKQYRIW